MSFITPPETITSMQRRSKALSKMKEIEPTIPYLEILTKTAIRGRHWGTLDLGPNESMTVKVGDHWLYCVGGNENGADQQAILDIAWDTENKYRELSTVYHTSQKKPKPENQEDKSKSEERGKTMYDCWPLPKEDESLQVIYKFHTGDPTPTILSPSFAISANADRVATSQVEGQFGITHQGSNASTDARRGEAETDIAGGSKASRTVPTVVISNFDKD